MINITIRRFIMRKIANGSFYSKIEQVAEKEELVKLLEQYKGI